MIILAACICLIYESKQRQRSEISSLIGVLQGAKQQINLRNLSAVCEKALNSIQLRGKSLGHRDVHLCQILTELQRSKMQRNQMWNLLFIRLLLVYLIASWAVCLFKNRTMTYELNNYNSPIQWVISVLFIFGFGILSRSLPQDWLRTEQSTIDWIWEYLTLTQRPPHHIFPPTEHMYEVEQLTGKSMDSTKIMTLDNWGKRMNLRIQNQINLWNDFVPIIELTIGIPIAVLTLCH